MWEFLQLRFGSAAVGALGGDGTLGFGVSGVVEESYFEGLELRCACVAGMTQPEPAKQKRDTWKSHGAYSFTHEESAAPFLAAPCEDWGRTLLLFLGFVLFAFGGVQVAVFCYKRSVWSALAWFAAVLLLTWLTHGGWEQVWKWKAGDSREAPGSPTTEGTTSFEDLEDVAIESPANLSGDTSCTAEPTTLHSPEGVAVEPAQGGAGIVSVKFV